MNANILNTIAAPSVTIAVRQPAKGAVRFVVTIATRRSALPVPRRLLPAKLAARFAARPTADSPACRPLRSTPAIRGAGFAVRFRCVPGAATSETAEAVIRARPKPDTPPARRDG